MTRSHRRGLAVPAFTGALAMATGLLAACSAGQLAATSMVVPAVPGAQGSVTAGGPTETIQIANATLEYNGPGGYNVGGNAPLALWIFNNSSKDITLTGVTSDHGTVVQSTGAHSGALSPCLSSAKPIQPNPSTGAPTVGVPPSPGASGGVSPAGPTGTPKATASAKPTGPTTPSGTVSASAPGTSPIPSPSPAAPPVGSTTIHIPIKAFGCATLTRDSADFLQIVGLKNKVNSGMTVGMSFTFVQNNGARYSIPSQGGSLLAVPVGVPASAGVRPPAQVTESGE